MRTAPTYIADSHTAFMAADSSALSTSRTTPPALANMPTKVRTIGVACGDACQNTHVVKVIAKHTSPAIVQPRSLLAKATESW